MNAVILSIGDELALGQVVDTNTAWLAAQLSAIGIEVRWHMTVADSQKDIEFAIRTASTCDLCIITGGLGPTQDDLTRQAIAAVLNQPLEMDQFWLTQLHAFFDRVKRPMPKSNEIQAMLPRTSQRLNNPAGTACGIRATLGHCEIFAMPGVPREMKEMFTRQILPELHKSSGGAVILSAKLHTFGLGESSVGERLGDLMNRSRNPSVGTTVSDGYVSLRINSRFPTREQAQRELDATILACEKAIGNLIWGRDEETLPQVVAKILLEQKRTVATAESCTGGLLAKYFTDIAGSSAYFKQGWVTYTNEAKTQLLAVEPRTIEQNGAVSEEVVVAMSSGARQRAESDFALAISGIAGPGGGTPEKPVGTVCISLATQSQSTARTFHFTGDRAAIRDRSAKMALSMLRSHLLAIPMPF